MTVSVVSTGESDRLAPCLRSLASQEFDGELDVILVQNGVSDRGEEITHDILPRARVIWNDQRRGFAENHNRALGSVAGDYKLILNPDVVLAPDCVCALVASMEAHPRAAVVAPLLSYPSGDPQPSARRFPRLWGTFIRRTPLRLAFRASLAQSRHYLPPPSVDRRIDWALGACLFVRESAWRAIGGFDPGFRPLYVEDVDLAWRVWREGWEFWQTPRARAVHEHQAATDRVFLDRRTLWHARGMLRFVRKHPRILLSARRPVPPSTSS